MASTYLSRTQNGTVTNNKIATFSFWIKRSGISSYQDPVSAVSGGDYAQIQFTNTDTLSIFQRDSASTTMQVVTTRVFRDISAWYHIVVALDTTQATASDRVKIYINGVQETSFGTTTYPAQNLVLRLNTASHAQSVGAYSTSSNYIDGSFAHFHQIDGTAYTPTSFGETDSTSGIWKPKTAPSVTYGTNGFFLKFANSASLGLDSSGNTNNLTVSGTGTQTQDNPSNNFATWNIIMNDAEDGNWSNGNTTIAPNGDATYLYAPTTIGVSSGKWYSEHMITGGNGYGMLGAISEDNIVDGFRQQTGLGTLTNSFGFRCRDGAIRMASSNTTYGSAPGTSDAILGMALDMDNKKVWYHINGTYVTYGGGVGNPGAGTYGFDFSSLTGSTFLITCGDDTASGYGNFKSNFGNGRFGTTALSSSNSDGNGYGLFEYSVPTGYYALCTKNIKLYGG